MLKALGSRLTYANVMATVAVFLALGGGAYALTGIPDRSGVYHGCVDPKAGALRVVKGASSCRKAKIVRRGTRRVRTPGESAIAWNQRGVPGVPGVQGIQGQKGDMGQDATKLFAAIGGPATTPTIAYGNGVTGVTRAAKGIYIVDFNRSLENCVVQVTPGFSDPVPVGSVVPALPTPDVRIGPPSASDSGVRVNFNQPTGATQPNSAPVDSAFMITAFC